ncbi:hypothetical protein AGLY_017325 [Aphis glycines]|uniref:Uncharacterized protein n=1 Tax=Aphis glycines TaxID=307491 RepID=A0A6G0SVJ0_APHGL|nr:hypothetical protein AGLY_017325 [Aphis glycines]
MSEISSLLSRRGLLKGQLTRFSNFVQTAQATGDIDVLQLKLRKEKINEVWQDFETVQTSIEEIGANEETEKYRTSFEDLYFESVAVCESLIINHTDKSSNNDSSNKNIDNGEINDSLKASTVSTAPLEIPNFTGIYSEWSAFHDLFSALVHQNPSLTDIQKFFYLRSSVSGDAQKTIQFLDTTSDNYKIAWNALISRYSNKKLAVQLHTKKLFDLESKNNESSTELRKHVDAINGHIKALVSLGQNPMEWGSLLLHIISIKLDASTLRQWEIESSKSEVASVNKLLEYLENRCQILEAIEASGGLKIVQPQQRQFQKNNFKFKKSNDQSSSFIVMGTLKCYNCDGAHTIYKCSALLALSVSDRIKRISELNLCKICLRNHIGEKCTSRRCAKCMKAHNSLLHLPKTK